MPESKDPRHGGEARPAPGEPTPRTGEPDAATAPAGEPEPASNRRAWKLAGVVGTALLVAIATTIGSGLGSSIMDLFDGDEGNGSEPISASAVEQISECGTKLFVPEERASGLISGEIPTPSPIPDWDGFRRDNGAAVADESVVQVSVQGESSRTVTLTGIDFSVSRQDRPPGATFFLPCGDSIFGRYVVADLDRDPVTVAGTSDDPDAVLNPVDPVEGAALSKFKPISFPWTVSVTDPLLLQIVAATKDCYCIWRAEIAWSSGGQTGVIPIDNGGEGYTVVGSKQLRSYGRSDSAKAGWVEMEG
jgi:hypothetical protein